MADWLARAQTPWSDRLGQWVTAQGGDPFLQANVATTRYWLNEHGIRIVVNAGAFALLRLLSGDRYKNRYELGRIGGPLEPPSPRRLQVDDLLGFNPGSDYYFGAVAVGGTGVRFYGEYCLVLRPAASSAGVRFLDRNSYDLLDPPLDAEHAPTVVQALRVEWADLGTAITTKVLASIPRNERLVTVGLVAELTLRDEDFIEAHLHRPGPPHVRSFGVEDVEEVRQAPEDIAQLQHLHEQQQRGRIPTASELLWSSRRAEVEELLEEHDLPSRVVTTNGRGARWR